MCDKTMTFSVNDEKELELKKNLTIIYDAADSKRLQPHQSNCWLYSFGRSDVHNHIQ